MKSDFEQAKHIIHRSVSSFDIAKAIGLPVNKYGRMNRCPFCNHEGNGGFIANTNNSDRSGSYYCFFNHHGGDCIDFVMQYFGFSYSEAVNWIISNFNLQIPALKEPSEADQANFNSEQKMRSSFLILYECIVELYCKILRINRADLILESDNLIENVIQIIKSL